MSQTHTEHTSMLMCVCACVCVCVCARVRVCVSCVCVFDSLLEKKNSDQQCQSPRRMRCKLFLVEIV